MIKVKHIFLIFLPAILFVGFGLLIQIIRYQPLNPPEQASSAPDNSKFQIPIFPEDPIVGSIRAPITIVAFEDFSCPACQNQTTLLQSVMTKHPDKIKIIWKGLAITRIPYPSDTALDYSFCANEQRKFSEFADQAWLQANGLSDEMLKTLAQTIGLNTTDLSECLNSTRPNDYRAKNESLARALNIQSVPAMFINNKQIEPPGTVEGWEGLLSL